MKIDGNILADTILTDLTNDVSALRTKKITPTLAVICIGDNPASLSYIKQKQKAAKRIGARLELCHMSQYTDPEDLRRHIETYNCDVNVHGLIIQRPLPQALKNCTQIVSFVRPQKDIDGFVPRSCFEPPVALAVLKILEEIFKISNQNDKKLFEKWLQNQKIVIIGRGETAGKPIADFFNKKHCTTSVIHSQTADPKEMIGNADIVISCAGKNRVLTKDMVKTGAICISVGIWRDSDGKLHGDYEEDEIKESASWYTPTPGGVGPVNVACLMQNLIAAAKKQNNGSIHNQ